jgi:hypothetical protein
VLGDEAAAVTDPDVVEVGGDVDPGPDCDRVDGIVAGVDQVIADVVVAAETDMVAPAQVQPAGGSGSIAVVSVGRRSTGLAFSAARPGRSPGPASR